MNVQNKIDALAVMDECRAYVDDAAQFPEQFKPGVVKRHQRQYIEARAAVAELIEAAGLRVMWINGSYYVVHADGKTAFSNIPQTAEGADAERAEAIRAALARCKGAQA